MSSLGAVVTSHLSLPHPGLFLHKSGKCRQLFAVLGATCHWKKMFQTSVILNAKIREYSTVVRFIWWVRWCDFNLPDAQISLCPTRTPYASQYVLGYLEVRSTCPMGQSVSEEKESYLSLPCLHQELGNLTQLLPKEKNISIIYIISKIC